MVGIAAGQSFATDGLGIRLRRQSTHTTPRFAAVNAFQEPSHDPLALF
jgi:hypothetical protein